MKCILSNLFEHKYEPNLQKSDMNYDAVGAFITWFNKDIFDRMIVAPLKDVEETIFSIALAYSIATIGTFV